MSKFFLTLAPVATWPVLGLLVGAGLLLGACPETTEEETGCQALGCAADQFCVVSTDQCISELAIEDDALEACVRETLGQADGPLKVSDARQARSLICTKSGIESLAGIEPMTGLQTLSLWENQVSDLTPLKGLLELFSLQLGNNAISDLGPLSGLTKLQRLGVQNNMIHELTPLSTLINLQWLNLDDNQIEITEALAPLKALTWLSMEHNPYLGTATVDSLQVDGCEVYKRAPKNSIRPQKALLAASQIDFNQLGYRVGADNSLTLRYFDGAQWQPVMREFAGTLSLAGDGSVLYNLLGFENKVGFVDGERAYICVADSRAACQLNLAVKNPSGEDAQRFGVEIRPVYSAQLLLRDAQGRPSGLRFKADGDSETSLDPYVISSPNQYDAGSCVFMANTGAMEILMHQDMAPGSFTYLDDTDLSERFLMNGHDHTTAQQVPYFITDLQYIYSSLGGSLLSNEYPFMVGYVTEDAQGNNQRANEGDEGASLSCQYNWFDDLPDSWRDNLTPTVPSDRGLIFVDPNLDQYSIWKVGLMNEEVIERIKHELRTKRQPVIIVYNHYRYWHADIIYGYDDNISIGECPMVKSTLNYFDDEDPGAAETIRAAMAEQGGCRLGGVFYVRDSIYDGGGDEPYYEYGEGVSDRYSRRVTLHTYDWVKYLANHAYTVQRKTER